MRRTSGIASLLAFATVAMAGTAAHACILEFRSTDWQVAQSALVVVGKIVKSTPTPLSAEWAGKTITGLISPTIADVEVEQVLWGDPQIRRLQIRSGPIRSCALYPVHIEMDAGKKYIFILPAKTEEGYQLAWAGSVQEMPSFAGVKNSIARCAATRLDYLQWMKSQSPEALAAATALDSRLLADSAHWPTQSSEAETPAELLHGLSGDNAQTAAADSVLKLLDTVPASAVEAALALDFARVSAGGGWSSQPLWSQVALRYAENHPAETTRIQQQEWSRLLTRVGATPEQIQNYFARVTQDQESPTLAFPIVLPDPFTRIGGENLTTDFLLRSQGFDRGQIYFCYGMTAESLKTLDLGRVKNLLPTLLASNNDHLKWAATTALTQMHSH